MKKRSPKTPSAATPAAPLKSVMQLGEELARLDPRFNEAPDREELLLAAQGCAALAKLRNTSDKSLVAQALLWAYGGTEDLAVAMGIPREEFAGCRISMRLAIRAAREALGRSIELAKAKAQAEKN
jgi:hypothetical protein